MAVWSAALCISGSRRIHRGQGRGRLDDLDRDKAGLGQILPVRFHPIGLPALYPPGDFKITLLGGSLEQAQSRQRMQNRFFKITDEEVASMKDAIAAALERTSSTGSKIAV